MRFKKHVVRALVVVAVLAGVSAFMWGQQQAPTSPQDKAVDVSKVERKGLAQNYFR